MNDVLLTVICIAFPVLGVALAAAVSAFFYYYGKIHIGFNHDLDPKRPDEYDYDHFNQQYWYTYYNHLVSRVKYAQERSEFGFCFIAGIAFSCTVCHHFAPDDLSDTTSYFLIILSAALFIGLFFAARYFFKRGWLHFGIAEKYFWYDEEGCSGEWPVLDDRISTMEAQLKGYYQCQLVMPLLLIVVFIFCSFISS